MLFQFIHKNQGHLQEISRGVCKETLFINEGVNEWSNEGRFELNDSWTCSKVSLWIKWFTNPLRSSVMNQNICDTRFEVTIWIQIFVIHTLKFRSEFKYLWYALWSSDLNLNICDTRFEVPIWIKIFVIQVLKFRSE